MKLKQEMEGADEKYAKLAVSHERNSHAEYILSIRDNTIILKYKNYTRVEKESTKQSGTRIQRPDYQKDDKSERKDMVRTAFQSLGKVWSDMALPPKGHKRCQNPQRFHIEVIPPENCKNLTHPKSFGLFTKSYTLPSVHKKFPHY